MVFPGPRYQSLAFAVTARLVHDIAFLIIRNTTRCGQSFSKPLRLPMTTTASLIISTKPFYVQLSALQVADVLSYLGFHLTKSWWFIGHAVWKREKRNLLLLSLLWVFVIRRFQAPASSGRKSALRALEGWRRALRRRRGEISPRRDANKPWTQASQASGWER